MGQYFNRFDDPYVSCVCFVRRELYGNIARSGNFSGNKTTHSPDEAQAKYVWVVKSNNIFFPTAPITFLPFLVLLRFQPVGAVLKLGGVSLFKCQKHFVYALFVLFSCLWFLNAIFLLYVYINHVPAFLKKTRTRCLF